MSKVKQVPPELRVTRHAWSDEEREAVIYAYEHADTAEQFISIVRTRVPTAPKRTTKAYQSELLHDHLSAKKNPSRVVRPVWACLIDKARDETLVRENLKKAVKAALPVQGTLPVTQEPAVVTPVVTPAAAPVGGPGALAEIAEEVGGTPMPPAVPPKLPRPPNFVKPDPNARVPRHYTMPTGFRARFTPADVAQIFSIPLVTVNLAWMTGGLPLLPADAAGVRCLTHDAFLLLHEFMSDGYTFEESCKKVSEATTSGSKLESELMAPIVDMMAPGTPIPAKTVELMTPKSIPAKTVGVVGKTPEEVLAQAFPAPLLGGEALQYKPEVKLRFPLVDQGPGAKATEVVANVRRYTLEAVRDKILSPTQAADFLLTKDPTRTFWALSLLGTGTVTVEQVEKLIHWD